MAGDPSGKTIGDYFTLQRGKTYKSALLGQPGPVLLGLASIRRNGGFRSDSLQTYGGDSPDNLLLYPGDLYVSLKDVTQSADLLGAIARVPANCKVGRLTQDTVKLEPKTNDVPRDYLYWLMRTPQYRAHCRAHSTGTTNLGLSREDFLAFPAPPPTKVQQKLVEILETLEEKIELNRRMNRTLEAMARAIFKSWFVDFDPVRAKAAGQKPPGLKPEIAALFPDAFEESALGAMPKGWSVTSLVDEITASKGLSYKGDHLCEAGEGLPMHNLNSVYEGGGYKNEGLKWYNGEYRPAHVLKPGDVIVTNTEQGFDYLLIGYAAIVPDRYGPQGLFSHHIFRIRPKPTSYLPPWFAYLLLRTQRFHDIVAGHSNGTTVNMLPLDGLQKPKFILPPKELVDRFGGLFAPIQQRLERIHDESISLAALRDALLPKLISGELRVPDAERIVGRAS